MTKVQEAAATANRLDSLSQYSTIVADTGEIEMIRCYRPRDCTTNPTLLLKAVRKEGYRGLAEEALRWGRGRGGDLSADAKAVAERLAVVFGCELLKIVPGYVSTEVDASLSFDTAGTVDKARALIAQYRELGAPAERVLIKIAATWEGIQAARELQREGINCNMTLIFSLVQAVASAEAGATLVSPFVGRITDWYKSRTGEDYAPEEDPGVCSVRAIYDYFKAHDYATVVMAASFRTTGQVEALAGCDRLTISPQLLEALSAQTGEVVPALDADQSSRKSVARVAVDEAGFRWALNENAMATEKLAEGIRRFHADTLDLIELLKKSL